MFCGFKIGCKLFGGKNDMAIKKVGVIGAGMMGAEIALCFAKAGYETVLEDISIELADKGKARLSGVLDRSIKKGQMDEKGKEAALANIQTTADLKDLSGCDLVIEAALEVFDIKAGIYKELNEYCKPDAIIASNTSSISITKLSSAISEQRKASFIGLHYNSPASVMKLVEVVPAILTDQKTIDTAMQVMRDIEKEPVLVKDVTGFALNRILIVLEQEALKLVDEGVCSVEDVDKVCQYGLGHPIGIFKLLDTVGIDLALTVAKIMFDAYGERYRPNEILQRKVDAGLLGKKTGKGFYDYE